VPFAVELAFDAATAATVRGLWRDLATAGVDTFLFDSGAAPHLTLAVYDQLDANAFAPTLAAFAAVVAPHALTLASIGVFPTTGVVFLAPVVTPALLAVHARFHADFAPPQTSSWEYYRPGRWVPHCTVAMDLPTPLRPSAVDICQRASLPITGHLIEVGLIEFRPVRQHYSFAMTGRDE
jgi:2'-5' RNA ligase